MFDNLNSFDPDQQLGIGSSSISVNNCPDFKKYLKVDVIALLQPQSLINLVGGRCILYV